MVASAASATTSRAAKILIQKVTARVFCQLEGRGGNPVTIFGTKNSDLLTKGQRETLARTCDWESVFVHVNDKDDEGSKNRTSSGGPTEASSPSATAASSSSSLPQMAFYMPTGEQVEFCAHAAMGGSTLISDDKGEEKLEFQTVPVFADASDDGENDGSSPPSLSEPQTYQTICHKSDIVSLFMKTTWTEDEHVRLEGNKAKLSADYDTTDDDESSTNTTTTPLSPMLFRALREVHDVPRSALVKNIAWMPSMANVSIVSERRAKTLAYLNSVEALHAARSPPVSSLLSSSKKNASSNNSNDDRYKNICDSMNSTGIYMYAQHADEEGAFECRQFPRASGYAEDPATGIAAAALAVSLYARFPRRLYKFYQGTAMGKPSLIVVDSIHAHEYNDPKARKRASRDNDDDNEDDDEYDSDDEDDIPSSEPKTALVSFTLLGRVEVDSVVEIEEPSESSCSM